MKGAEVWHMRVELREVHGQAVEVKRLVQRWRPSPAPEKRDPFRPVGWYANHRCPPERVTGFGLLMERVIRIYNGEPYPLRVRR